MKSKTLTLLGLSVALGLIGCGTLKTDDIQGAEKLIGNENQEGTLNTGADSNQGQNTENVSEDTNEGKATTNTGKDVNTSGNQPASNGDLDGDGIADIDDADIDGDGIANIDDSDIDGDGIANIDDADIDGDGVLNTGDNDIDGDGIANIDDPDIDGDGILNTEDPDMDGDGILNTEDPDMDGDGIINELDGDMDGDGILNTEDPDMDGDGIDNSIDPDIDGDGILNEVDTDMDGDGIDNGSDPDANGDGIDENTNIDAGVTVKVEQLDTTGFETFASGLTVLTFYHTVDLADIRQKIQDENLQLGTVQIEDLTITLVNSGDAAEFVADYPNNKLTVEGSFTEGVKQQVVYSLPNSITPTMLSNGISIGAKNVFVNATGFSQLNKSIQDASKPSTKVQIDLILTEPLAKEYQLSFEFAIDVLGKKVIQ